jgi:hypothetical protein
MEQRQSVLNIVAPKGMTYKGVLAGIAMVSLGAIAGMYANYVSQSSGFSYSNIPLAAFLPFTLFVVFVNPLLKMAHRDWALGTADLVLAFSMAWVGSMFAARAIMGRIIIGIAAPYYIATPENGWADTLHPHFPTWILPQNREAMRGFFEGLPAGVSVPWEAWLVPAFWWTSFLLVLLLVMFGVSMLLRRQWEERERLTFALAEQPLTMARDAEAESLLPAFMNNRLFWIGFAIPAVIILWNMLTFFNHILPKIPITQLGSGWSDRIVFPWKGFPNLRPRINFYVTGFVYLSNTDVLLSIILFYILAGVQSAVFHRIGYTLPSSVASYGIMGVPIIWQNQGAIFFIVLWGLWMARDHLKEVWQKAVRGEPEGRTELLTYRQILVLIGIGSIYLILWLCASGMGPGIAVFFTAMYLVILVGMTKIVAETGLPYVSWSVSPHAMVVDALGAHTLSPSDSTAFGFSLGYASDKKPTLFTSPMHSTVLVDRFKQEGVKILIALMLAAALSIILAFGYTLMQGYAHGAHNFGGLERIVGTGSMWNIPTELIRDPQNAHPVKYLFFGIGMACMALLTVLRYRFTWWRLNPIGFAISGIQPIYFHAFNIFLVLMVKVLVLSTGGIQLYNRSKAIFMGILVGYTLSVGVAFAIDLIWFPGDGHLLHTW